MDDNNVIVLLSDISEYLKKIQNGHWNLPTQMKDEAEDLINRIEKEMDQ